MARFPRSEAEILALAQELVIGLSNNVAVYPSPPISVMDMATTISAYTTAKNAAVAAQAAAEQATSDKEEALDDSSDAMKAEIRYAENTVNYDDDKLKLIGWAGRAARTDLAAPGQARLLEAPRQGEGWVFPDWKAATDGGKPSAYKVMRRIRPDGPWEDVATAVITEITLVDQERGKEWEYRIVAINKSGEGEPSNTVMAVL
ncbi:MAG: fibronectin type III domain-containing protein [Candidatus Zixiibacteriota bacterium]